MNSVSSAPGFNKNVWVMAGVPKIMQSMFIKRGNKFKKGKKYFKKQ